MSNPSPTQRTLAYLRDRGATCEVVEHWNPFSQTRKDPFGFIDIISLEPGRGIVAIQTTSGKNHAARRTKILTGCAEYARQWLASCGRIEVWSWSKRKAKGTKLERWIPRIEEITPESFEVDSPS